MLISCLGFTVPVWGAEQTVTKPGGITYEMQDIEVQYAASFTAYPVGNTAKPTVTTSVYDAVYSNAAKPLQVLYGVVKLTNMLGNFMTEEFISVSDGVNSARGLSNGFGPIYNSNMRIIGRETEFYTGKKLAEKSVVKDYSDGVKAIKLSREWDAFGNPIRFGIRFNGQFKTESDPFFQKLTETSYEIDLTTLRYVGKNQVVQP